MGGTLKTTHHSTGSPLWERQVWEVARAMMNAMINGVTIQLYTIEAIWIELVMIDYNSTVILIYICLITERMKVYQSPQIPKQKRLEMINIISRVRFRSSSNPNLVFNLPIFMHKVHLALIEIDVSEPMMHSAYLWDPSPGASPENQQHLPPDCPSKGHIESHHNSYCLP